MNRLPMSPKAEMEDIRYAKEQDDKRGEAKYSECFSMKDRILWRTMIGVLIQVAQQGESNFMQGGGDDLSCC